MPIPMIAAAAGQAALAAAPDVYERVKASLTKVTNGRVKSAADLKAYVAKSPQRLSIVTAAMARAGVSPSTVFPSDVVDGNKQLEAIRTSANQIYGQLRQQAAANADTVVPAQAAVDSAMDGVRIARVAAILDVYGSEEKYFLCHPKASVPAEDFAYAAMMKRAVRNLR